MEPTARTALAAQLAATIPAAPAETPEPAPLVWIRPAWLDGRTERPRRLPAWLTPSDDTPPQVATCTG